MTTVFRDLSWVTDDHVEKRDWTGYDKLLSRDSSRVTDDHVAEA